MSKEVANQKNETGLTKYDPGQLDGFELVARGVRMGITGTRVKYIKGEYFADVGNTEGEEVPIGTKFLFDMDTLHMGFVFWEDGVPVDAVVVRVADNVPVPQRRTLGDTDKSEWPEGSDGRIKDPWSPDARVRMFALDHPHGEFTFVSSSWGGKFAIEKLCRKYVAERGEHPGELPVVELNTYKRQDKNYGKIDTPVLDVVGWAALDDVMAVKKKKRRDAPALPHKSSKNRRFDALEAMLTDDDEG